MRQDVYYVPPEVGTLDVKFTPMKRGVAAMTISYKDRSVTFEMPGWYCDECGESIHTGEDMKVSDRVLAQLKVLPSKPARVFNAIPHFWNSYPGSRLLS